MTAVVSSVSPPNPPPHRHDLGFLDGVRGVAAAYVMIGHARWLLWEGHAAFRANEAHYGPIERALAWTSALFRFGHQGVVLFFVLSGLVIHLRYARDLALSGKDASFDLVPYLRRRSRRIYPPLLLALFVTLACDFAARMLHFASHAGSTVYVGLNKGIGRDLSVSTFVGNMAFLMPSYVPTFGSNGPLWSLSYEWWFYMLYPLAWMLARHSAHVATFVLGVLFLVAALPVQWPIAIAQDVLSMMAIWWLGAILAEGIVGRVAVPFRKVGLLAALLPLLPFVEVPLFARDLVWGLGFFGLLSLMLSLSSEHWSLRMLRRGKLLGDFSYTLYVVHFPLLALLCGYVINRSPDGQLPRHFGWAVIGIASSLLLGYLGHLLVEQPFASRRPAGLAKEAGAKLGV